MEYNKKEIGKRIARVRSAHNLTQEQLSEKLGCSPNHLSGIECGKYNTTIPFLYKLCKELGNTPDYYLLGRVSDDVDELTQLVMRLSESQQHLLEEILETYLRSNYRE